MRRSSSTTRMRVLSSAITNCYTDGHSYQYHAPMRLLTLLLVISLSGPAFAQGKGQDKGRPQHMSQEDRQQMRNDMRDAYRDRDRDRGRHDRQRPMSREERDKLRQ